MSDQPAGQLLDALGVTLNIKDDQQLTEVVVISKATDFGTGGTNVIISTSDGLDWVAQLGLIHAARLICDQAPIEDE
jgi:hypothetical protein